MSQSQSFNNTTYQIPVQGDTKWGPSLTRYLAALGTYAINPAGGLYTLTADLNFGNSFGLLAKYFSTGDANPATAGHLRLSNTNTVRWRNFANSADLSLAVNTSDQLTFGGTPVFSGTLTNGHIIVGNASNVATDVAMSGDVAITNAGATTVSNVQAGVITNAMVSNAAAIAYSKLSLTASVVNADIATSAAIAYSKLALTGAILNADLAGSIAYSKLSLTGAILNADLAGSIAYSKLVLTGAILNADLAGSIAYSKLTLTGAILNADLAGSIAYSKLTLTGAILNADINASAAIAVSKLAAMTVSRDIRADSSGFLAVKPLAVQATTTTAASVTSSTFTTTNLTASITPSNTSARIRITVSGDLKAANVALANANLTIARGSTNLASTNGFALTGRVTTATGTFTNTVAVVYIDSPGSSTAVTYNVQIRSDDNTTAAVFPAFTTGVITLEEIS